MKKKMKKKLLNRTLTLLNPAEYAILFYFKKKIFFQYIMYAVFKELNLNKFVHIYTISSLLYSYNYNYVFNSYIYI